MTTDLHHREGRIVGSGTPADLTIKEDRSTVDFRTEKLNETINKEWRTRNGCG